MSFLNRLKKGKIAPVLQDKLDQLSAPNGSAAKGLAKDIANGKAVDTANGHAATTNGFSIREAEADAPRVVIIGAGSRGSAYARAITNSGKGHIVAVCEPAEVVRREFGRKYIWGLENRDAKQHEAFPSWPEYIAYEEERRQRVASQEVKDGDGEFLGADAAFICVLDEMHVDVVKALAPLQLHIMCEKPLATTLEDCIGIYGSVVKEWEMLGKKTIFSICHVLRYSPHNMLLHKLVREEQVVGDVISIEHTEPVGWWHFTHSYVRGNWRRSDTSAPSLLTKSCHDIDFILWMLCSPAPGSSEPPHLPSTFTSSGTLNQFRKARKPLAAKDATNCLKCPIGDSCNHSAKNIYMTKHFEKGDMGWPVKIVVPEIEDIFRKQGKDAARSKLLEKLGDDYNANTPDEEIKKRNWFGRCVWESDNNVCDDQTVTITWDDDPLPAIEGDAGRLNNRGAKSALFHMIAPTHKICERRGRIYGTYGEISYDSYSIDVHDFSTGQITTYKPTRAGGGHGGGDDGLAMNFLEAVRAVKVEGMGAVEAQRKFLGCSLEEVVRSHAAVFAAERARVEGIRVEWGAFWEEEVEKRVGGETEAGRTDATKQSA